MAKTKTASKTSASSKKKTAKKSPAKKAATKKKVSRAKAGDQSVTVDRRRKSRRTKGETAESPAVAEATPEKLERRAKVNRRRQIDPTTCERDYSDAEVEFMSALDDYKRKSGRMFPTCSEILEVIRGLNYVQLSPVEAAARNAQQAPSEEQLDQQVEADAGEALEESEGLRVMAEEFAEADV